MPIEKKFRFETSGFSLNGCPPYLRYPDTPDGYCSCSFLQADRRIEGKAGAILRVAYHFPARPMLPASDPAGPPGVRLLGCGEA